jgi:hypothetical protein
MVSLVKKVGPLVPRYGKIHYSKPVIQIQRSKIGKEKNQSMEIGKDLLMAYVVKTKADPEAERKKERKKLQRLLPAMSSHPAHANP